MNDSEFFREYMQEIRARAGSRDDFSEEQFTEEMCDFLVDQAVIENYDSAFFKKTQQGIRIDAWSFNKDKRQLNLFICAYFADVQLKTLTQSEVDKWFARSERFFHKAKSNTFWQEIEESLPVYKVARDIATNINFVSKIQFFLLTNGVLSSRVTKIKRPSIPNFKTSYDIWDISRRAKIAASGKAKEDILIDFKKYVSGGIKCLPASIDASFCKSYLLAIPGAMLAEIYDEYGEQLLEQNVRTFLQFRGGVNKGIRNTLKNQPEMFFAFNNGLTLTAEDIETDEERIYSARNLQIVNGGQTTASIFMAKMQNQSEIDLERIYVQAKLSIIDSEKVDDLVPLISKCANTQNKVSAADFFSNHPFHKRIEDFSRRTLAPASSGAFSETYWFYERARGQYANRQAKMTPTKKRQFLIQNPKSQMFTKTDLAKYENSFAQHPHFVSKGAQWNFGKFAEEITGKDEKHKGLWEKNEAQFNELYFKQLIAKAIIFKSLDKVIMEQDWYGGYKANIVTYTLAKFANLVAERGRFIDYLAIWKRQTISAALLDELVSIARNVNAVINDTDENVTQYCKKLTCWNKVKDMNFSLSTKVLAELISVEESTSRAKGAKKEQKLLNSIDTQVEVVKKGVNYWTALFAWVHSQKRRVLSDKQMSILSTTYRMNTNLPSPKQCKAILEIEQIAIEEGFYYKE